MAEGTDCVGPSPSPPGTSTTPDKDEAIASFSNGLWARYNNTTWVKLHNSVPTRFATGNVDGTAGDDLVVDFGSRGVWIRYNNTTWTQLTPAISQDLADRRPRWGRQG